jgi:hypothetical protein
LKPHQTADASLARVPADASEIDKRGHIIIYATKLEISNVEDAAKQAWHRATEELTTKATPTKKAKTKR